MRTSVLLCYISAAAAQYGGPKTLAEIDVKGLKESSGVVASRKHPGVFWTHNDGEGGPYLFAIDREGKRRGRVRIAGAAMYDWEDIAAGPGGLYIGDIGDNARKRKQIIVYRVAEPHPDADVSKRAETIRLTYPDGPHDAEALLVHPKSGDIYIVTKARGKDARTLVFKAPAGGGEVRRVAEIDFPNASLMSLIIGRVTGGDISPDGRTVALCDYFRGWEASLPRGARTFDTIWAAEWRPVDIGSRKQGEAIAFRHDGQALIATSEGKPFPLIEVERKK